MIDPSANAEVFYAQDYRLVPGSVLMSCNKVSIVYGLGNLLFATPEFTVVVFIMWSRSMVVFSTYSGGSTTDSIYIGSGLFSGGMTVALFPLDAYSTALV